MLDAQLKPLLDAMNAAAVDAPPNPSTQERRDAYLALASVAGPGPQLDHVSDRVIPGPAGDIPIRVYRNDGSTGIFVFFHGGGWAIGDLDTHDEVCRQLAAQSRACVVAVDYRLAPEHVFPAAVDDSWAALEWIAGHRTEFGADDAKIVVGGDSAGGNLSAVVALMARDSGLELAGQLLVYPGTDMADDSPSMTENGTGYFLDLETMTWFMEQYSADPTDWRASPMLADAHAGVAPALVLTAGFDPLRDQGAAYARTLASAGVEVTHTNYDGLTHVFFQLGPLCATAADGVAQVAAYAASALA
ncbi:MAG: alpha/beta hydrolase [Ilumatobacteraceae bacterium]